MSLLRKGRVGAVTVLSAALAIGLLGGCRAVPPAPTPTPAAEPAPPPVVQAPPPARPAQPAVAWDVAPVSEGRWSHRLQGGASVALFGPQGAAAVLVIECAAATRQIVLRLPMVAGPSRTVTIHTSYGALQWPGVAATADMAMLRVSRPATDSGFDWIAFSRGRIGIAPDGATMLVVPTGAEIARVVEDCRG
jgi:hypothetical protein